VSLSPLGFPFWMLRRERLDAIHCKQELEVDRLLGPERAVVIKGRDPRESGTKSGEPSLVTFSTNATIAFFNAVSFQEGRGPGLGATQARGKV
jgi:hypothetical protein